MKVAMEVKMRHSVEVLWPYLADPERWPDWIPALVERTRLDSGAVRPDSTWKSVDRVGPFRVEFTDKLIEIEPMRRVVFEQSAPWNGWGEYLLEPSNEDEAMLSVRFEAKPTGVLRLLDWLPDAFSAYVMKKDYLRLDNLLDKEALGATDGQ
jgi:uncharacterized protein YndB with AHSA1/START domain